MLVAHAASLDTALLVLLLLPLLLLPQPGVGVALFAALRQCLQCGVAPELAVDFVPLLQAFFWCLYPHRLWHQADTNSEEETRGHAGAFCRGWPTR